MVAIYKIKEDYDTWELTKELIQLSKDYIEIHEKVFGEGEVLDKEIYKLKQSILEYERVR